MVRARFAAVSVFSAGLALLTATQAQADDFSSATALLNSYNLIVFGNVTDASEVDGKAFIGGSLSGTGNFDIHNVQSSAYPALTVGGTLSTTNLNLNGAGGLIAGSGLSVGFNNNGNGNIYVNGNISGVNLNIQNGMSVYATGNLVSSSVSINNAGNNLYLGGTNQGSSVNVNGGAGYYQNSSTPAAVVPNVAAETATAKSTLTSYSASLATLSANNTVTESGSTLVFDVTKTTKGVAVFDITSNAAALLNSATQMEFTLNGAKEVIINVEGVGNTALHINANFLNGVAQTLGTNTVWNFTDAKSITTGAQFGGDILAVLANVTNNQDVEGAVVAATLTQNAEIHYDGNQGNLVSPVPLPGALVLFGSAIVGVGGYARRRRRQQKL